MLECNPRCLDTWIAIHKMIGRHGSLLQKANIQVFSSRFLFMGVEGAPGPSGLELESRLGRKNLAPGRAGDLDREPLLIQGLILTYNACNF